MPLQILETSLENLRVSLKMIRSLRKNTGSLRIKTEKRWRVLIIIMIPHDDDHQIIHSTDTEDQNNNLLFCES